MFTPRFLIVSLGNPLPQYESLHSAGHFAVNGLAQVLRNPGFRESTLGKYKYLVSHGTKYTLVQSPTLMNVSGPFVARAWQDMAKKHDPAQLSLVVLHDELEKDMGVVKLISWDRSHKGHNGLKSVQASLSQKSYPQSPFARVALGIGRPESRERDAVSRYVLARISGEQRRFLENEAPWQVAERLIELEDEWKAELKPSKKT